MTEYEMSGKRGKTTRRRISYKHHERKQTYAASEKNEKETTKLTAAESDVVPLILEDHKLTLNLLPSWSIT